MVQIKKLAPRGSGDSCNTSRISSSKKWFFTCNNYTQEHIEIITGSKYIGKYIFQEEKGENGVPHLQGYVEFKEKQRPIECLKNKQFHWEKAKNTEACIQYCQKIATREGRIYNKGIPIKEELIVLEREKFYPWQEDLLQRLLKKPDDRSVIVVIDELGNSGKSQFQRHLIYHYGAALVTDKDGDIKHAIASRIKDGQPPPKIVLVNIPRAGYHKIPYSSMEEVKDGLLFSGKYESNHYIFNHPHVVLFVNYEPEYDQLTEDRWIKIVLSKKGEGSHSAAPNGEGG